MQTKRTATAELPEPIAAYFTHEATDPAAVARCFTEAALVVDERREHRGRPAIEAWIAAARRKFDFATEVLAADSHGRHTTVRSKLTGSFPGSPTELRYRFTLADGLIDRLEIAP